MMLQWLQNMSEKFEKFTKQKEENVFSGLLKGWPYSQQLMLFELIYWVQMLQPDQIVQLLFLVRVSEPLWGSRGARKSPRSHF